MSGNDAMSMMLAAQNRLLVRLGRLVSPMAILLIASDTSFAMPLTVIGQQVILSGPVVGNEPARLADALAQVSGIDTVILRNSPGGDAPAGYRVGELIRVKGLRTAVSGYCYSSCSRMFLGGKTRYFTDDYPPEYTDVGFHGHYDSKGRLLPELVHRLGLKNWIIQYSDGKADPALVERWINIPRNTGMAHFYHPGLLKRHGVSAFMCQGSESTAQVFDCEPIRNTALDLGVITSLDIVKSNDQAGIRAGIPDKPRASGYARITDTKNVPLVSAAGRQEYQRFLKVKPPRAFAISPGGKFWAWNAGTFDATSAALTRCHQRSQQTCRLYAVDEEVVWSPNNEMNDFDP
jgi:hypothetical protein